MHLHCNNLGAPGNIATTLETMKLLEGRRAHIAHLQYHAYGGDGWGTMCSEAAAFAEHSTGITNLRRRRRGPVRRHGDDHRRRPWQHLLYQLTGRKWGNLDVENETGCGIVPYSTRTAASSTRCSGRSGWSCCC